MCELVVQQTYKKVRVKVAQIRSKITINQIQKKKKIKWLSPNVNSLDTVELVAETCVIIRKNCGPLLRASGSLLLKKAQTSTQPNSCEWSGVRKVAECPRAPLAQLQKLHCGDATLPSRVKYHINYNKNGLKSKCCCGNRRYERTHRCAVAHCVYVV